MQQVPENSHVTTEVSIKETEVRNGRSYFMDKILPSLITAALAAGFGLVGMYFAIGTLSNRVGALEAVSVRKDVLEETLEPIKEDVLEIKSDVKESRVDIKEILMELKK